MRKPYPLRGRANGQRKETRARAGASVRARCRIVCGPCWRIVRGPHTRKHAQGARGRHPPPEYEQTQLIRVARALLSLILLRMLVLLQLSLSRAIPPLSSLPPLSSARSFASLTLSYPLSLDRSLASSPIGPQSPSRSETEKKWAHAHGSGSNLALFYSCTCACAGRHLADMRHAYCVRCVRVCACVHVYIYITYISWKIK